MALYYYYYPLQNDQITEKQRLNYHMSVVEREVQTGMLSVADTKTTCLALNRYVNNVNMNDNKGGKNINVFVE
jgi:hypothetical protein